MELTHEILIKNGFESNHPERSMPKFYIHGPEYRIVVDTVFHVLNTMLGYDIKCYKYDNRGAIVKQSSVAVTNTAEDLQRAIDLCDINKEIIL